MLREEKRLKKKGYKVIVGLDEAGRGPLAGPVVAAAVVVKDFRIVSNFKGIKDSKKLTKKQREWFYDKITNHSKIDWQISRVSERVIDRINILEATKLAMKRSALRIKKADFLLIDGNFPINVSIKQKSVIKADEKIFSCQVASVLAKVYRDKIMERYHKSYPEYNFIQNKGYPTKEHRRIINKIGFSKIHRKTFSV